MMPPINKGEIEHGRRAISIGEGHDPRAKKGSPAVAPSFFPDPDVRWCTRNIPRLAEPFGTMNTESNKQQVRDFWQEASCGEDLYLKGSDRQGYLDQSRERYRLEPYIEDFAAFQAAANRDVLEVGVGLGADHQRFAEAGARLTGIDLTERAIEHVKRRFELFGLRSNLRVDDAENLSFEHEAFDLVYSWGVIHHSPRTERAIAEIHRVLRPGGTARVMIYHKWSLVGYMLWFRYALLRLRPFTPLSEIYSRYLESPGTKAFTIEEARRMFAGFTRVDIRTVLTHSDLLESAAGQRHRGVMLAVAQRLWPRFLLRRLAVNHGLLMLITAVK
jgi:SAM-dependent methyltransferase